jgi:uncharacterized protein YndB with AHSA1/START domain
VHDLIAELEHAKRAVGAGELRGATAYTVEIRRHLGAPVADVWSACTDPERLARWFLPVSGDLRPGGRFQLEGNAGGTITACDPPHRLEVTWEFGRMQPSVVGLELAPAGEDATELALRHTVPDDDHWAQYGPGAVGVGWELPIAALATLIAGTEAPKGGELMADPRTIDFMRHSAIAWGRAHEAAGASPEMAQNAAYRTSAFYAPA